MVALGDSITVAFDATQPLSAQPQYSWATGTVPAVKSVAARLRASGAENLNADNLAVPGARMDALASQAGGVPVGTGLVTVLLGANDACTSSEAAMTPVADFRTQLDAGLSAIADRGVERIVVASVPDVYLLWQVGGTDAQALRIWNQFAICPTMLAAPQSTAPTDQARRERVRQRIEDYNEQLALGCAAVVGTDCTYDEGAVFDEAFELSDLSAIDFFHPSPAGQAAIAEVVFDASGYASSG